jgi:hypothetical protein
MISTIGRAHYARPAPVSKDMKELIALFTQIALLRRGPQDLPASMLLLVLTIGGYLCVNLLVALALPALPHAAAAGAHAVEGQWLAPLLIETLFTLVWYVALLRFAGRPERTLQTVTAVFGLQTVLAPLTDTFDWLMVRFSGDGSWQVPVACAELLAWTWLIAANSYVVKAALEWSSTASVVLVILQVVVEVALLLAVFAPGHT